MDIHNSANVLYIHLHLTTKEEKAKVKPILCESPVCIDERKCFAAGWFANQKRCLILRETYELDRECPFCKWEADVTDDVKYPIDTRYGRGRT